MNIGRKYLFNDEWVAFLFFQILDDRNRGFWQQYVLPEGPGVFPVEANLPGDNSCFMQGGGNKRPISQRPELKCPKQEKNANRPPGQRPDARRKKRTHGAAQFICPERFHPHWDESKWENGGDAEKE